MNREHYEALSAQARRVVDLARAEHAPERDISRGIDLVLGDRRFYPDVALHPNETGVLVDPNANRHVRFGAGGKGGGDFIGIFKTNSGFGLFIEAEIKTKRGFQSTDQKTREQLVTAFGGSYRVLRSIEDAEQWIRELRERTGSLSIERANEHVNATEVRP